MPLPNNSLDIGPNDSAEKQMRLWYYDQIVASGLFPPELVNLKNVNVEKVYWRLVNEGLITHGATGGLTITSSQISNSGTTGRSLIGASTATDAKTILSLENVSNTSDANKPVSTAQQNALNLKSRNMLGTYAARPAPNTVLAGTTYDADDTNEIYISNGTDWLVYGGTKLLGSNSLKTIFNTQSTGWTDVTNFLVVFVAGERPITISLACSIACSDGNQNARAAIKLDGNVIQEIMAFQPYGDKWDTRYVETEPFYQVPGTTHTAQVSIVSPLGTGFGRIDGNATKPSVLKVVAE